MNKLLEYLNPNWAKKTYTNWLNIIGDFDNVPILDILWEIAKRCGVNFYYSSRTEKWSAVPTTWKEKTEYFGHHTGTELLYYAHQLPAKSRKKVYEVNWDWCVTYIDWWEFELEDWKERLEEKGFEEAEIYFSGFSNQGDGACFDIGSFSIEKFLNTCPKADQNRFSTIRAIKDFIEVSITTLNYNYSHEHTRIITCDLDYPASANLKTQRLEKLIDEFRYYMETERLNLCRAIYSDLNKSYNQLTEEETFIDALTDNEVLFHQDGSAT